MVVSKQTEEDDRLFSYLLGLFWAFGYSVLLQTHDYQICKTGFRPHSMGQKYFFGAVQCYGQEATEEDC